MDDALGKEEDEKHVPTALAVLRKKRRNKCIELLVGLVG